MATIFYGVSGEGRGHAARARVLIDLLRGRHRVVLLTYGAALEMLQPIYYRTDVEVRAIFGMRFRYDENGTLNRPASFLSALPFLAQMESRAAKLAKQLNKESADLVIADFEPLMPRAATMAGVPVMSVDHQQFLTCYDLSSLPKGLRKKARFLSPFVSPYYRGLTRAVVSAFFFPPLKKRPYPVVQAGVLLRPEILQADPEDRGHLVAYVRRRAPSPVLRALAGCGRPVYVYGHGDQGKKGSLVFRRIDPENFAADLATSSGLVTSAGNQVVGEALSLGKPVLAYPEPGNFEQLINGHFLEAGGQGWSRPAERFDDQLVLAFLACGEALRDRIRPDRLNGNRATLAAVEFELASRYGRRFGIGAPQGPSSDVLRGSRLEQKQGLPGLPLVSSPSTGHSTPSW